MRRVRRFERLHVACGAGRRAGQGAFLSFPGLPPPRANRLPLVPELLVIPWLKPASLFPGLLAHAYVDEPGYFLRFRNKILGRFPSYASCDDEVISDEVAQIGPKWHWYGLRQSLDLNANLLVAVLVVRKNVDASRVPRSGHHVPPAFGKFVAHGVQPHVANQRIVLLVDGLFHFRH